ncbi:FliH/SctL family protein [Simiduia curdlanivorans]|uniref:Flagellar assembly protein FliH n=1 Tax=Simiduia curdlanivorans TaxID=1492769 RepID=A0ABV8V7D6_9GAMM|nr:FliH/SctL family protein [Simiduia curdlanivorans]MDN3639857.1 FliH/SctL family protein [Simiduia curdlanivorans]
MASSDKAYISAENATHAVTWLPPQVGKQANKIPSAEKEAREAKRREAERAKERVEDVEPAKYPTTDEIAAIFDAARKEGFAEGFAAGMNQGLEQGRAEGAEKSYAEHHAQAEQLKAKLQAMLDNLAGPAEQEQQHISAILTQVIKRLTRKLVMTELSTPSPHIENLVSTCVALLPATQTERRAVIQLHPDDLAYLRGEAQLASILSACEWQPNADVAQGGCLVISHSSQLDARVESQLQTLFENFDNGRFSSDAEDEPALRVSEKSISASVDHGDSLAASSESQLASAESETQDVFKPAIDEGDSSAQTEQAQEAHKPVQPEPPLDDDGSYVE